MTEFFEKTWFIWWIVATLAILRWFHLVSINGRVELELEDAAVDHEGIHGCSLCWLNSLVCDRSMSGAVVTCQLYERNNR